MNFSDNDFKELEAQLKIKNQHLNHLKSSIHLANRKSQNPRKKRWIPAVVITGCLLVTAPIYSPALANVVEKIKPLIISNQSTTFPLTTDLTTMLSANGYDVSSVGFISKKNVIEVGLEAGHTYEKSEIEQIIHSYLTEQGYDLYSIKIIEMTPSGYIPNPIYEDIKIIVKNIFTEYGYAEEANYELAGIKETLFSNIVLLDMPDHIKESDEIITSIENKIKEQNLDVKKVEVTTFNLDYRILDNTWGTVATAIYNAMAGQSIYQLQGQSYFVKNGHATIEYSTAWETKPSNILAKNIEQEILSYLQSEEVISYLPNQSYTIKFVNDNNEVLLQISN